MRNFHGDSAMSIARRHLIDVNVTRWYHCMSRSVRGRAASRCQTFRLRGVRFGFWFPRQWTTGSDTEKQMHRLFQSNRLTDQGSNNTFGACYPGARRILLTRKTVKTGPDPLVQKRVLTPLSLSANPQVLGAKANADISPASSVTIHPGLPLRSIAVQA
jgi:hypothetical protein